VSSSVVGGSAMALPTAHSGNAGGNRHVPGGWSGAGCAMLATVVQSERSRTPPSGAVALRPSLWRWKKVSRLWRFAFAGSTSAAMAPLGRAGGADGLAVDWLPLITPRGLRAGAATTRASPSCRVCSVTLAASAIFLS
jgi:hypothetical protein